ncbi:hypothetical protein KGM_213987 [Danaus plexippus plexippus]|uniref:Uncharacterized protein n=1 Tax=Danaus plexippus plexippus TaxID=278856 RepID=A0A212F2L6_DANPL|nr:hypothetical protein KGM_213987 [Danaus plexippus plexippus]
MSCEMSASGGTTPTMPEAPAPAGSVQPLLDDRDLEPRTPMKRLGSTRKLAAFSTIDMCENRDAGVTVLLTIVTDYRHSP